MTTDVESGFDTFNTTASNEESCFVLDPGNYVDEFPRLPLSIGELWDLISPNLEHKRLLAISNSSYLCSFVDELCHTIFDKALLTILKGLDGPSRIVCSRV
jgi:hypothetical protein